MQPQIEGGDHPEGALGADLSAWHPGEPDATRTVASGELPLQAGIVTDGTHWVALNRPPSEDVPERLPTTTVSELFQGLDFHIITGSLQESRSLTNEVWRTFLVGMALALLAEALLCFPAKATPAPIAGREPQPAA